MTTLRESLEAAVATAEADLEAKKAQLANIEKTGFVQILEHDVDEVKTFFRSIASHLFPHSPAAAAVAATPAAPAAAPATTTDAPAA